MVRMAALLATLAAAGCSMLEPSDTPAYQRARQAQALEVPPDLRNPTTDGSVPDFIAADATAQELDEFARFRQFEDWNEYEQYQRWKEQGATDDRLDFQAYLAARKALTEQGSSGGGVSTDTNFDGSIDVRVAASGDDTMEVVEAALSGMGVEILGQETDKYRILVRLPDVAERSVFRSREDQLYVNIARDQQDSIVSLTNRSRERVTTPAAAQFMQRLAGQVRVSKIRMELDNTVITPKALRGEMTTDAGGHLQLGLDEAPEAVWQQIDYVIDQVGFTVLERSPGDLSFRLRFATDAEMKPERKGLEKLAFWNRDDERPEGSDVYRVRVVDDAPGSRVTVEDHAGAGSVTGDAILELLREKL